MGRVLSDISKAALTLEPSTTAIEKVLESSSLQMAMSTKETFQRRTCMEEDHSSSLMGLSIKASSMKGSFMEMGS